MNPDEIDAKTELDTRKLSERQVGRANNFRRRTYA
jgi:hypothetical protein